VVDPCVIGEKLQHTSEVGNIQMGTTVVGECYLSMISDWWRQDDNELKKQYLSPIHKPHRWHAQYGGSCDNDVHEHFKCLVETVFAKAFIHETEEGYETYNCRYEEGRFVCEDPYLQEWVIYSEHSEEMILNGTKAFVSQGMNVIRTTKN